VKLTNLQLFKNLSDETRLGIVLLLREMGELCVCDLCTALEQSQPKISRHLAMLRESGLLLDRKQGKWVHYRLSPHIPSWAAQVIDQVLVDFSADVQWLKGRGVQVERYNLAQQPMSFVQNEKAKAFLEASGAEGLPLLLLDGETVMAGRYPKRAEIARWFGIPLEKVGLAPTSCCGSNTSCC